MGLCLVSSKQNVLEGLLLFFTVLGINLLTPIFPQFIYEFGFSALTTSFIFSGNFLTTTIFSPLYGQFLKFISIKKLIMLAVFLRFMSVLPFILLDKGIFFVLARLLQGLSSAIIVPAILAIGLSRWENSIHKARYFNRQQGIIFFAMAVGPLISGLLVKYFSVGLIFQFYAVICLFSFVLTFFLNPQKSSFNQGGPNLFSRLKWDGLFGVQFGFGLLSGSLFILIPLKFTELGFSTAQIGILCFLLIFSIGMGHGLSSNVSKVPTVSVSGIILAGLLAGLFQLSSFNAITLTCLFIGLCFSLHLLTVNKLQIEKWKNKDQHQLTGLQRFYSNLGQMAGALLTPLLLASWSQDALVLGIAVLSLVVAGVISLQLRASTRKIRI